MGPRADALLLLLLLSTATPAFGQRVSGQEAVRPGDELLRGGACAAAAAAYGQALRAWDDPMSSAPLRWSLALAEECQGAPVHLARALGHYEKYLAAAGTEAERAQASARVRALRRKVASVRFIESEGEQPATAVRVDLDSPVLIERGGVLYLPPGRHQLTAWATDRQPDQATPAWRASLHLRPGHQYDIRYDPREMLDLRFAVSVGIGPLLNFLGEGNRPDQFALTPAFEYRWPIVRRIAADLVIQVPIELFGEARWGAGPALGGRWALLALAKRGLELEIVPTLVVGLMFLGERATAPAEAGPSLCAMQPPCEVPAFVLRANLGLVLRFHQQGELRLEPLGVSTGVANDQILGPRFLVGMTGALRFPRPYRFR